MFFDLNIPLPQPVTSSGQSKKNKQKQQQTNASDEPPLVFSPAQIAAIEARIDLLVHLGYTVLALNQTVYGKVDSRTHVDWLQGLLPRLKKRHGVVLLTRLTVVPDEGSEKETGVNPQNATLLSNYDILSLRPTTQTSFSNACLAHTAPSPHTAHIISLPVTFPRLPFHMRHTLIRTALKNGAVFEIDYAGAVGAESERRSWWGGARELVRVTKGKGVLLSGGVAEDREARAPRDAANLMTLLGIPPNLSHDAVSLTPKSVVLRAQSRKTYRSVLSEPRLVVPSGMAQPSAPSKMDTTETGAETGITGITVVTDPSRALSAPEQAGPRTSTPDTPPQRSQKKGKKRRREEGGRPPGEQSPKKKKG